jgi:Flp pilus assembly protein TadB
MAFLLAICFTVGLALLVNGMVARAQSRGGGSARARQREMLKREMGADINEPVKEPKQSLSSRIVGALSSRLEGSDALHSNEGRGLVVWLDEQLILAGIRDRYNPYQALGTMLAIWTAATIMFVMVWLSGLALYIAVLVLILGLIYPPMKVRQLQQVRKDLIDSELAFFIMELVMALSSGRSNIDDAMMRVARNNADSPGAPLAREFELACNEYRVGGRDREEALMGITRRTRNEGVEALVDGINAALKTGTNPLAALREQSEQARRLRKQSLRTYAARMKPKGTLGMVATMGGGVIMLVTPLIIGMMGTLQGVGGASG